MPPPQPLDRSASARLADFARGVSAAARAVSLYPATHPSVQAALASLVEVVKAATQAGAFRLTVLPDGLLLGGRAPAAPPPVVPELARLLHRHQIVGLEVHDGGDVATWETLLGLLARPPDEIRGQGGIAQLWGEPRGLTNAAQRRTIVLREVDYEVLLRERPLADPATLGAILEALRSGQLDRLDPAARAGLNKAIRDPDGLEPLATELAALLGGDPRAHAEALLQLLHVANAGIADDDAATRDAVLANLAHLLSKLPAPVMTELLTRDNPTAGLGGEDAVQVVAERMTREDLTTFVSTSIVAEGGASARLAEAFQALLPDVDERRQLLSQVERRVSESPLGQTESFRDIWDRAEKLLASYSDEQYVNEQYARELNSARTQAAEVEQVSDDPEERIGAWLTTIDDPAMRALDIQLLLDLLRLESDPHRWRDICRTVAQHAELLTEAGQLAPALKLIEGVAQKRPNDDIPVEAGSVAAFAIDVLERLAAGPTLGHIVVQLRTGDDRVCAAAAGLCWVLGAQVVTALVELVAGDPDERLRGALRDIVVGFGAPGQEAVRELLTASNWEIRQLAVYLLRGFAGADELGRLKSLLADPEPGVQREAMLALIERGDEPAYQHVAEALRRSPAGHRTPLLTELRAQRNERVVPLCRYLLTHLEGRRLGDVRLAAIDVLGAVGGDQAVEVLREALHGGQWWAPFHTHRVRGAAARALRNSRSPTALQVLRDAATLGPWGVRVAARAQLSQI